MRWIKAEEAGNGDVAELTKTKSFPRPWYLAKWRKPVSLRSRNEEEEVFTGASMLIEEATIRELGYLRVR